ncbi:DUF805 domain-containing protein [Herbiconiux solani]|uniref:DUF805 domain-containing protein n=1 Tax=Herbiconiux solani TaxID=661329 RepID=UPI001FE0A4C6|nr:DUF805 domain-containing protein [Herbiconiux solani]
MTVPAQPATAVPLDAPYYDAPFGAAVSRFWKKYATFTGRAGRAEFWWWWLVNLLVNIVFNILAFATGGYGMQMDQTYATPSAGAVVVFILWGLWALATIIPNLALFARRLHDVNLPAWWILIGLVPVGGIVLLVMAALTPNPAGARFDR